MTVKFAGDGDAELRSRLDHDPARDLYAFRLDLLPEDGKGESVEAAQAALARIRGTDIAGCNGAFDKALRAELDRIRLLR